ncbi:MAG: type I secretion system permease/ATPase [Pseudomonadota bacterium]
MNRPAVEVSEVDHDPAVQPRTRRRRGSDPLLQALQEICRAWHLPFMREVCLSGMPLNAGRIELNQFPTIADRAGIKAKIRKVSLKALRNKHCPCILLLRDQSCAVITAIDDTYGFLEVLENGRSKHIPRDQFAERFCGKIIEIAPGPKVYQSSEESDEQTLTRLLLGEAKRNLPYLGEVLLASLIINLFVLAIPFFMMNVYDRVVPNLAFETLWALAIGVTLALFFDFLIKSLRANVVDGVGLRLGVGIEYRIMQQLLSVKMSDKPRNAGAITNSVQEFSKTCSLLPSALIAILVDIPFFVVYLLIIQMIGGPIVIAPIVGAFLICVAGITSNALSAKANKEAAEFQNQKFNNLIDSLSGLEYFKSHSSEAQLLGEWDRLVDASAFSNRAVYVWSSIMANISAFIVQGVTILVMIIGVYEIKEGNLSVGGLVACTILSGRAMLPMSGAINLLVRTYKSMVIFKTVAALMKMPDEKAKGDAVLPSSRLTGQIDLHDVSFTYPTSTIPSLKHVSFSVAPGERVGLIGKIGSGKSTIIRLLLGLYAASDGKMMLDGVDAEQMHPAFIRSNMGAVLQDPYLIDASIKENLTFGLSDVSDEALERAAELSGVKDFVAQHPAGFALKVGPRGSHLSGGQRQAIGIARGIIHEPPILLMDEPTASLDSNTELQFIENMRGFMQGRTVVLATHRIKLLELVDRIIWLDSGRVIADGPVNEILSGLRGKRAAGANAPKPEAR